MLIVYICNVVGNANASTNVNLYFNFYFNFYLNYFIMTTSKFAFSVATPKVKGDVTVNPELTVTVTKDKIRVNTALSRKLNLKDGDRLMFISNEVAVWDAVADGQLSEDEVQENLVFAIAKGIPRVNSKGQVEMGVKRLKDEEKEALDNGTYEGEVDEEGRAIEPNFHGFKLASNSNSEGFGILEGSDATNWPALKGSTEVHRVYSVGEAVEAPVGESTVTAYVITFEREEAKMERKASVKTAGSTVEVEDEDDAVTLD